MPAPIRKKMRRWNDESGSRSKRAPALTVRDMAIPPEKMHTSIRAGGSSWQAAPGGMPVRAGPGRSGAVAIAAEHQALLGESAFGLTADPARAGRGESCAGIAVTCNEWAVREMGVIDRELRRARFP